MKTVFSLLVCSMMLFVSGSSDSNTTANPDPQLLVGTWKLDMSPENKTDNNFAMMRITSVGKNSIKGFFYREGVKIREGRINTQTGILYGAVVSGDNSGDYNTAFYYKNGVLYGSTHALDRDFLSVWTATKEK